MSRLSGEIDGRRFLRAMARFGWTVRSQHGSHRKLAHPRRDDVIIVAFHDKLDRRIVRRLLRYAGIDEDAFLREL